MEWMKHFDIWFGGLFFLLGTAALGAALALFVFWPRVRAGRPGRGNLWVFMAAPLICGLVFTLVGGGFMGYGIRQYQVEQRLLASGVTEWATVVDVERTGTRVNGQYLWLVRYEYRDPSGNIHEGTSGYLERREAQSYRIGETVYVRFDPAEPSTSIWLGRQARARTSAGPLPT